MTFLFEPLRAMQALSFLVERGGGRLRCLRAVILMYLSERRSLIETGSLMLDDSFVSGGCGPELCGVSDLVGGLGVSGRWLCREGLDLCLVSSPGDSELSDYWVGVLGEVFDEYAGWEISELISLMCRLPEWGVLGASISWESILLGAGVSETQIEAYAARHAAISGMARIRRVVG